MYPKTSTSSSIVRDGVKLLDPETRGEMGSREGIFYFGITRMERNRDGIKRMYPTESKLTTPTTTEAMPFWVYISTGPLGDLDTTKGYLEVCR